MKHVVLLGDSIFDNGSYVRRGEPDVVTQVRSKLPPGWRATLLAQDGAVTGDVIRQLRNVPPDASNLVVSAGGNNARGQIAVLLKSVRTVAEALVELSTIRQEFQANYQMMLDAVLARQLPTKICTIYDGCADLEVQQSINLVALAVYNDIIIREVHRRDLPLIDLRLNCNEPDDYANSIEPNTRVGEKIAAAIVEVVTGHSNPPRSQVFTSVRARRTAQDAIRSSTNQERL
jgi:hypothetical protein